MLTASVKNINKQENGHLLFTVWRQMSSSYYLLISNPACCTFSLWTVMTEMIPHYRYADSHCSVINWIHNAVQNEKHQEESESDLLPETSTDEIQCYWMNEAEQRRENHSNSAGTENLADEQCVWHKASCREPPNITNRGFRAPTALQELNSLTFQSCWHSFPDRYTNVLEWVMNLSH